MPEKLKDISDLTKVSLDRVEEIINSLDKEVKRFQMLLKISQIFQSEMDLDTLLPLIIQHAAESIDADRCSVFVFDSIKKKLWTRVAQKSKPIVIPHDSGIAGWVLRKKEPLIIPDAYADPRFDPTIDAKTGYRTRSIIALPLLDRYGKPLGVFEGINKLDDTPFTTDDLEFTGAIVTQIAAAIENAKLYTQIVETFESFLDAMASTIDAKHPVSRGHSRRVANLAKAIAKEMQLSEEMVNKIYWAALLHDYGKIYVPDSILQKAGKLTKEEYIQIQRHALLTYGILEKIHFADHIRDIPLIASEHHEKFNGEGYPFGKSGEMIPLGARVIAVADVFDALTSFREYHTPMSFDEGKELILKDRGTAFDPDVVDAFIQYYEREFDPYKLKNKSENN